MMRKGYRKLIAAGLAISMISQIFFGDFAAETVYADTEEENTQSVTTAASGETFSIERMTSNYTNVSVGYTASTYTGGTVVFPLDQVLSAEDAAYLTGDNYDYANKVADVTVGDVLHLQVDVPQTALYWVGFDYLSYDQSILPIELSLKVDGDYPFYETRNLSFETTWVQQETVSLDRYGNEIVSLPDKLMRWESKYLSDASYRYAEPLLVELTAGVHDL